MFVSAQQKWSLSECIEYAHANNLQIKQAMLNAEVASNNYLQSKMNILPDLNVSASRNYNFGHQIDSYTNNFISTNTVSDSYGLSSNLNLFAGLQNYNAIKANEFKTLSLMQDVEREKVEIGFEIAAAYLKILFNQELLEVAKNQREITSLQVDRTDKLVQAGNTARGDLLEIFAQLAAEDLNVTNAKNELNLSYLNLTQLLDIDSVDNFDIVTPDTVNPDFTSEVVTVHSVYTDGLLFLPHIKSAEFGLQATKRNLAIQKGLLSPIISFNGSWQTGYSDNVINDLTNRVYPYLDQLDLLSSKSLYFSISIPIFNRWEANTKISNARIGVLESETTLDLTKQQLYKEIQQAYNDAISAKEKHKSANEAVNSYKEAFGYTEQKYNVGMLNSVEYNIAKNNYIKAESELLKAKYEYIFAIKILDYYRGVPLTL
jgi:outer membrane protein